MSPFSPTQGASAEAQDTAKKETLAWIAFVIGLGSIPILIQLIMLLFISRQDPIAWASPDGWYYTLFVAVSGMHEVLNSDSPKASKTTTFCLLVLYTMVAIVAYSLLLSEKAKTATNLITIFVCGFIVFAITCWTAIRQVYAFRLLDASKGEISSLQ